MDVFELCLKAQQRRERSDQFEEFGGDLTFDIMLRRWDEESVNMQDRAI